MAVSMDYSHSKLLEQLLPPSNIPVVNIDYCEFLMIFLGKEGRAGMAAVVMKEDAGLSDEVIVL